MISPELISFAKENNLKTDGVVIFGVYEKQIIIIKKAVGPNYFVGIKINSKQNTEILVSSIKQSLKNSCSSRQVTHHESFLNIELNFALKKNIPQKLTDCIGIICKEMKRKQSTPNSTDEIFLKNGLPSFQNETMQEKREPTIKINNLSGFIGSISISILVATLFGFASAFFNFSTPTQERGQLTYALLIGFLLIAIVLFRKFANMPKNIRTNTSMFLSFPIAITAYLVYNIAAIYYSLKYQGYIANFDDALAIFYDRLIPLLKFSLIVFGAYLIPIALTLITKKISNKSENIEYGEYITEKIISEEREKSLMKKRELFIAAPLILFSLFMGIVGLIYIDHEFYYMFKDIFYLIGSVITALTSILFYKYSSKIYKNNTPSLIFGSLFFATLFSIGITSVIIFLNVHFDYSEAKMIKSELIDPIYKSKHNYGFCFKIKNWTNKAISNNEICEREFGTLIKNDTVNLHIKDGFLKIPWVHEIELQKHQNFEIYLKTLNSEKELYYRDFKRLYDKDPDDKFLKNKISKWKNDCLSKKSYKCRLVSYEENIKNNIPAQIKFLEYACDANELKGCYGLYIHKKASYKQKNRYLNALSSDCKLEKWKSCHSLAEILWKKDYNLNYDKLFDIYSKSCKVGRNKFACDRLSYIKKRRPLKKKIKT